MPNSISEGVLVTSLSGRRHRFMESADFTAANRWAYQAFSRAATEDFIVSPLIMGFEMDPVSPGIRISTKSTLIEMPHKEFVALAVKKLQSDAESPYALAAFASPVGGFKKSALGRVRAFIGVRIEFFSVDRNVSTIYEVIRTQNGSEQLRYAPLNFLNGN